MKVFLSGPISGVEGYKKRFREAETALKAMGHEVYSPAVLPEGMPWEAYMRICEIMQWYCDCTYMLAGWHSSRGARLEHDRAINKLKQKVFYEDGLRGIKAWTE